MNTIYLIRHSVKYSKDNLKYKNGSDRNNYDEKICLSVIGEKRAETLSKEPIFNDVELIYSSNMVRSIQTAKYLAKRLDLEINIDSRLNERKCGLPNYNEYPDWFERQYYDENFKTIDGESQKETCNRVYECIK